MPSAGRKAPVEGRRHLADEREVELGTAVQRRAERIDAARARVGALDDHFDHPPVELGFGEHAPDAEFLDLLPQFGDASCAGGSVGAGHGGTGGSQAEAVLEVPVGVVEHDERLAAQVGGVGCDAFDELVETVGECRGVRRVRRGVRGIGGAQGGGDGVGHGGGVYRVQPDVHVDGAVVVRGMVAVGVPISMVGVPSCMITVGVTVSSALLITVGVTSSSVSVITVGVMVSMVPMVLVRVVVVRRGGSVGVMAAVVVDLEVAALPQWPVHQAVRGRERDHLGVVRERRDRARERGLQGVVDKEYHVGILQPPGVRRAQAEVVRRRGAAHDEVGLANALHHGADDGVDGFDGGHDAQVLGERGHGQPPQEHGVGEGTADAADGVHGSPLVAIVPNLYTGGRRKINGCGKMAGARTVDPAPLVEVRDIGVRRGTRWIIRHVDLRVPRGQLVYLIGGNGAGKSTCAKAVLGLIDVDEGAIERAPSLAVGYVPQRLAVTPTLPLTLRRMVTLTGRFPAGEVDAALATVGLERLGDPPVTTLSGGEFQRLLLARELLRRPDLLVLDEPDQGVDVAGAEVLHEQIDTIRRELDCGVLVISHDLKLAMDTGDDFCVLVPHEYDERPGIGRDPGLVGTHGSDRDGGHA